MRVEPTWRVGLAWTAMRTVALAGSGADGVRCRKGSEGDLDLDESIFKSDE